MLSFLLLFGCTTEETLKEKGLRLLPIPNEDFFVRAEHRGIDNHLFDECGHKYFVKEYDYNKNGRVDAYMFYSFNPEEIVYEKGIFLPNIIFYNPDEKGNIRYMWTFRKETDNYIFEEYKPYKPK